MGSNKKRASRGGRGRFKNAGDALDQLLSIEHAQHNRRMKKTHQIIDSSAKSIQRLMTALDRIKDTSNAHEEIND
jgi:hypothetical protein